MRRTIERLVAESFMRNFSADLVRGNDPLLQFIPSRQSTIPIGLSCHHANCPSPVPPSTSLWPDNLKTSKRGSERSGCLHCYRGRSCSRDYGVQCALPRRLTSYTQYLCRREVPAPTARESGREYLVTDRSKMSSPADYILFVPALPERP